MPNKNINKLLYNRIVVYMLDITKQISYLLIYIPTYIVSCICVAHILFTNISSKGLLFST